METPGSIIDKLITVDLKMWNNQEALYEIRRMTYDGFCRSFGLPYVMNENERGGLNSLRLYNILKKACDLNVQRNDLIQELDRKFEELTGKKIEFKQHKTY